MKSASSRLSTSTYFKRLMMGEFACDFETIKYLEATDCFAFISVISKE